MNCSHEVGSAWLWLCSRSCGAPAASPNARGQTQATKIRRSWQLRMTATRVTACSLLLRTYYVEQRQASSSTVGVVYVRRCTTTRSLELAAESIRQRGLGTPALPSTSTGHVRPSQIHYSHQFGFQQSTEWNCCSQHSSSTKVAVGRTRNQLVLT